MSHPTPSVHEENPLFVVAQLAAPLAGKAPNRSVILSGAKNPGLFPTPGSTTESPSHLLNLSSRATRAICLFFVSAALTSLSAAAQNTRPKILGIGRVRIEGIVTQTGNPFHFYPQLGLGTIGSFQAGAAAMTLYAVDDHQELDVEAAIRPDSPHNNLSLILFQTTDVAGLHDHLQSRQTAVGEVHADDVQFKDGDGKPMNGDALLFTLQDPEGHWIGFIQYKSPLKFHREEGRSSLHLIHAGFIVRDRAATEHFYKDILGFRPYWHGGMKDDQTDWVSMQVPDGSDWIEMMVNVSPDADQRVRGIMNHIAIGVTDIHATEQRLTDAGVNLTQPPKIGRDGKWQLNVYDPDQTRIEFMEFTPVQKPCCSDFTAPHPQP